MRRATIAITPTDRKMTPIMPSPAAVSVPAVSACTVEVPKSTKLPRWICRQRRRGMRRRASDVSSTASSMYIAMTPHATATGCHDEASGTNT